MHKMWLVAKREYLFNLKRRSFLFAAFGIPLFVAVIMLIVFTTAADNDGSLDSVGMVGYVDQAGILAGAVGKPDSFVAYTDEAEVRADLDDQTIGAYFVLPADYTTTGRVNLVNYSTSPEALRDAITDFILANLAASVDTSLPLDRIKDPVSLTVYVQDSGRALQQNAVASLFITPMIFSFVFLMATQISSSFLMNGVVEEKTNRIMEILVTSVTPMQMLLGKLIGLGALGLTQLAVWGVVAVISLRFSDQIAFLAGVTIPPELVVVGIVYFVLGYFFLSSIMAGIGAVAGSEQESRQYAGILSLPLIIPFFAIGTFIADPNGTLPIVLSMIPFTAPLTMILRVSLSVVPLEQILVSVAILFASTVLITWLSARIFRWGLLLYGKRITPREIWQVMRRSPTIGTTAAHSLEEV